MWVWCSGLGLGYAGLGLRLAGLPSSNLEQTVIKASSIYFYQLYIDFHYTPPPTHTYTHNSTITENEVVGVTLTEVPQRQNFSSLSFQLGQHGRGTVNTAFWSITWTWFDLTFHLSECQVSMFWCVCVGGGLCVWGYIYLCVFLSVCVKGIACRCHTRNSSQNMSLIPLSWAVSMGRVSTELVKQMHLRSIG